MKVGLPAFGLYAFAQITNSLLDLLHNNITQIHVYLKEDSMSVFLQKICERTCAVVNGFQRQAAVMFKRFFEIS